MYLPSLMLALAILLAPTITIAQERASRPELTPSDLIERLVSPNSPVNPKREHIACFPRSYNEDAQKVVDDAAEQLCKRGYEAIPALIKSLEDQRYCRSRSYSVVVDFSVGGVCYELIEKIVTPGVEPNYSALKESHFKIVKGYPMRESADGVWRYVQRSFFDALHQEDKSFSRKSISKWWEDQKFKSIEEVHLAAVQQAIRYEDSIGYPKGVSRDEYLGPCLDFEELLRTQQAERIAIIVPFRLTDQNNIIVSATVNGRDKLDLMLHTAASDVMLTEEGAKKALSVKFTEKVKMESWGGSAESRLSRGNLIEIGGLSRKDVLLFEDQLSGKESDGKFGLDFFEKRIVEIDFDASRITVYGRSPDKLRNYQRLKLIADRGQLFVEGKCVIEGKEYPHQFLIHSGYAGGILLDDAFAAKTGIDGKVKILEESSLKDSFGNEIKVKKGVLPEFVLGDSKLADVPVGFFAGGLRSGEAGNQKVSVIGCEILKRFHLIFDVAQSELYFLPRR